MNVRYETTTRDGHTLDILADDDTGIGIVVTRRGAELVSLTRQNARGEHVGFLWRDGDITKAPEGWNNHATVMGYFLHRIKNERTTYRGHEIRGGTHSFLRHKDFDAPLCDKDACALTYRIVPGQFTPDEYPFKVALSLTYALQHGQLRVTFHFENLEPDLTTHVSFGLHPGFGASSFDAAEVIMPEGDYVRHFAPDNFLSGETKAFHHPGGPMPFEKSKLPGSFLLELKDVPQPIFALEDRPTQRRVELDFREVPYVTLWSNGQPFICIEPCWGMPDHHEQRPFEEKLGMQIIPPRGTLTRSFTIEPQLV
jgi:galactose mutarotase-like enzyme